MPLATDDRIVESMFLSPRVVDAATFEELAGVLRILAQRASERRTELEQSVASAQSANHLVEQLGDRLKSAVTPAARLVQTLDDRIEKAQQSVQRMLDPEAMIRSGLEASRRQIETALQAHGNDALDALISRLEQRLGELESKAEAKAQERIERLREATDACEHRLAQAQASLAGSVKATEASIASITRRAVEQQINAVIVSRLAKAEEQALERINTLTTQAEQRLSESVIEAKQATDRCQQALREIEPQVAALCSTALTQTRQTIETVSSELAFALDKLEKARDETLAKSQEMTESMYRELLDKLNATTTQATIYADRTEDSLVGLEARAAAIGERLARRIDELSSNAEAIGHGTLPQKMTIEAPRAASKARVSKQVHSNGTSDDAHEHEITISAGRAGATKPTKKPSARCAQADGSAA